jgi:hypothetical protein
MSVGALPDADLGHAVRDMTARQRSGRDWFPSRCPGRTGMTPSGAAGRQGRPVGRSAPPRGVAPGRRLVSVRRIRLSRRGANVIAVGASDGAAPTERRRTGRAGTKAAGGRAGPEAAGGRAGPEAAGGRAGPEAAGGRAGAKAAAWVVALSYVHPGLPFALPPRGPSTRGVTVLREVRTGDHPSIGFMITLCRRIASETPPTAPPGRRGPPHPLGEHRSDRTHGYTVSRPLSRRNA